MRTTIGDILRLAWALYRCPARRDMRIGQLIENAAQQRDPCVTSNIPRAQLFYQENSSLTYNVAKFWERTTPPSSGGG
jgi:hypothetical protein